ncbi:YhcH/YjgK/YiaL family protein [Paenibacillus sedimenti]|uniref:YhcH/YjgK/YiaL family protein n=1 Tax=Paenibacillus sedimenti TaxID=2770274 RepID=A0A926KMN7_9BACL|nr:YhcH/YjgK/YiaL family protein [Paenibacillus sedimenti]MBD0378845.1 YhcH/YjgK/YiaL family protein [Paenibacillus sedimenti]
MILDTISQWKHNQGQYGDAVRRALAFVANVNIAEMPSMLEIDGKRMYVMKQSPATGTFEEKLAESHAQHADIHVVAEGEKRQGFAPASENNRVVEDRLEENDYALYSHVENETRILLRPGDFSVYWPGEVHRPNCHPEGSVHLVKLVVKIHRDLF